MIHLEALVAAATRHAAPSAERVIRPRGAPWAVADLAARVRALAPPVLEGSANAVVRGVAFADAADQLAATLAAWEAGDAVLPLDPAMPLDRLVARATALGAASLSTDAGVFVHPLSGAEDATGWALALPRPEVPDRRPTIRYTAEALETCLAEGVEALGDSVRVGLLRPPRSVGTLVLDVLAPLVSGGSVVLVCDLTWPSSRLDLLAVAGADAIVGAPEHLLALARAALDRPPADRPALKTVVCESGPFTPALATLVREAFPGVGLQRRYGSDAVCPLIARALASPDDGAPPARLFAFGGRTAVVVDAAGYPCRAGQTGLLRVRGPGLSRPAPDDAGLEDRCTGDLFDVQAEGALLAVGRADDQVRIEGTPVHPSRIAAHLRRSPGVDDAMVVPVVDPWGTTRLVAFVVSDIPAAALAPELTRSLRAALDGPERPHRVVVRRELPRGALGAPDLAALARLAEHALGGPDAPTPDSNAD